MTSLLLLPSIVIFLYFEKKSDFIFRWLPRRALTLPHQNENQCKSHQIKLYEVVVDKYVECDLEKSSIRISAHKLAELSTYSLKITVASV